MATPSTYIQPERAKNSAGEGRKVGVELEFAGISPEETAKVVLEAFGGNLEKVSEAEYTVSATEFGAFRIELDWSFGKNLAKRRATNLFHGIDDDTDLMMKWMTSVAGQVVPTEIVCPPIPIARLHELDQLGGALKQSGAEGTEGSVFYAFGLHLNPEIPDLSAATVVRYLQSFIVSQYWLMDMHQVDISRRVSPYIELFDAEYAAVVLAYTIDSTSLEKVITDYLRFNPSRNRALDMLPLFKHIDPTKIHAALGDEKVNSRPTFHYRLPNCEIGRPGWSLSESWNLWCLVEHLTVRDELRAGLMSQWQTIQAKPLGGPEIPWHFELSEIYRDLLSE